MTLSFVFPRRIRSLSFFLLFMVSLLFVGCINQGPKLPDRVYQLVVQPDRTFQVAVEYSLAKLEERVLTYPGYEVELTLQQVRPDVTNSVISDTLGKPPSVQINLARNGIISSWMEDPSKVPEPFYRSVVKIGESTELLVKQAEEGAKKKLFAQVFVSNKITPDEASRAKQIVEQTLVPHQDRIGSICLVIPQTGPDGQQWANHEMASTVFSGLPTSLVGAITPMESRSEESCLNK